eukprot:1162035-Pelagomonas_calceolata.AAC.9
MPAYAQCGGLTMHSNLRGIKESCTREKGRFEHIAYSTKYGETLVLDASDRASVCSLHPLTIAHQVYHLHEIPLPWMLLMTRCTLRKTWQMSCKQKYNEIMSIDGILNGFDGKMHSKEDKADGLQAEIQQSSEISVDRTLSTMALMGRRTARKTGQAGCK